MKYASIFFLIIFYSCSPQKPAVNSEGEKLIESKEIELSEEMEESAPLDKGEYPADFSKIDEGLLMSEPKPYNIDSYYKFYKDELDEAKRVLSGKEEPFKDLLDTLDKRNGFMRVKLIGDGHLQVKEFVYWNLSNNKKLFAVNHRESDFIDNEYTSFFEFRIFNEGSWEKAKIGSLQELMKNGKKITLDEFKASTIAKSSLSNDEINDLADFEIELPQSGKGIKFTFMGKNPKFPDEENNVPMKSISLKFSNGTFEVPSK